MKILYFTSTGNSLCAAKRIGGELLSIPHLQKEKIYDITDDVVGIVSPVYYGNVPRLVREYLKKVNINAKYVFTVLTYGGAAFGASSQIQKLLKKRNIIVNYANEILMVDNYLPLFDVTKEIKKKDSKTIDLQISNIAEDIKNKRYWRIQHNVFQIIISSILLSKKLYNEDKKFVITGECNACGTCQMICPKSNIVINARPQYQHNCEFCLACIHACPKNAIHLPNEKSSARFINPNVKLAAIIQANKQSK